MGLCPGHDGLTPSMIKVISGYLVRTLAFVVNFSFCQGIVPNELKRARVVLIFKKGNVNNLTNYRPISVLPCLSKVYERTIYNRIVSFLELHNILSQSQLGFRKRYSTSMALLHVVDLITSVCDAGNNVMGVFIDLSKTFDTVNHEILLRKLKHYDLRGLPGRWMNNYLTDRTQFVEYNGNFFSDSAVSCGVPQGSILGPLLFILYINDLRMLYPRSKRLCMRMTLLSSSFFFCSGCN
jgi:hypothetical protein